MKKVTRFAVATLIATNLLPGCAAIQHRNLEVQAKMSETIFLDAETLSEGKPLYVRVTNTSDFQDIDFGDLLRKKLGEKGRKTTMNPKEAAYQIQANVLYVGEQKQDYTYEGAIAGGFGGVLGGSRFGHGSDSALAAGAAGIALAGAGALVGSMIHVDDYLGVCDLQVKEHVAGGVKGTVTSNLAQGNGTSVKTERTTSSDKQEYRTRIAVKATQTNIDRKEATSSIAERLASQIAGLFN